MDKIKEHGRGEVGVRGGRFDCLYFWFVWITVCHIVPLNDNLKVRHCVYISQYICQ